MIRLYRGAIVLIFFFVFNLSSGQDILKNASPIAKDLIDTLFIDNDVNNWSLRAFGSFKDNTIFLRNDIRTLKYVPLNRYGVGLGYANSKVHFDFGFNIRGNGEEQTDRINFAADLTLNRSFIGFRISHYQGFEVRSDEAGVQDQFRDDISTFSVDLFYTVVKNSSKLSLSSVLSGSQRQKKNAGSFIGGLFAFYHQLRADSSIVKTGSENDFNEQAQFEEVNSLGLGVSLGYSYNIIFGKNFFISLAAYPGAGLNFKKVVIENGSYRPDNLLMYMVGLRASIGYNGPRYYVELSDRHFLNSSSFNFGNRAGVNSVQIKLAVGWKWKVKKN